MEERPIQYATSCQVYLTNMDDYAELNTAYSEFFAGFDNMPTRLCIAVAELPANGLVEVQCEGHYDGPWAKAHGLVAGSNATQH